MKVETAPIEIKKMPRYLTLTGSVVADRQSEVAANVSGRVQSAPVERGQQDGQGGAGERDPLVAVWLEHRHDPPNYTGCLCSLPVDRR